MGSMHNVCWKGGRRAIAVSVDELAMLEVGMGLTLKSGGVLVCVTTLQRKSAVTIQKKIGEQAEGKRSRQSVE